MKKGLIFEILMTMMIVILVTSCNKDDDYVVIPVVYGVTGSTSVTQSETKVYEIAYQKAGSTWSWSVSGADLDEISTDTRTATISFTELPANDTAYISVTETTSTGLVSDVKVVKVYVEAFCVLDINDFVGAFDCDELGYHVYGVNFTLDESLANTIVNDNYWDWPGDGAVIKYTLSGDFAQTVTVPKQEFVYGDGYVGWVEGSGTYSGCSATMVVDYITYYGGEEYDTHHEFSPSTAGKKSMSIGKNADWLSSVKNIRQTN